MLQINALWMACVCVAESRCCCVIPPHWHTVTVTLVCCTRPQLLRPSGAADRFRVQLDLGQRLRVIHTRLRCS